MLCLSGEKKDVRLGSVTFPVETRQKKANADPRLVGSTGFSFIKQKETDVEEEKLTCCVLMRQAWGGIETDSNGLTACHHHFYRAVQCSPKLKDYMRTPTKVQNRATEQFHMRKGQQALFKNKSPLVQRYTHIKQICTALFIQLVISRRKQQ